MVPKLKTIVTTLLQQNLTLEFEMQSLILDFGWSNLMDIQNLASWARNWIATNVSCVREEWDLIPIDERIQGELLMGQAQLTLGPKSYAILKPRSRKR